MKDTGLEYRRTKRILEPLGLLPFARRVRKRLVTFRPKKIKRREVRRFYAQFVSKGDLVFDVGANMGDRAKVFLELGAKVVCVEPLVQCVEHLRKLFGSDERVTIVDKALGEKECTSSLMVCDDAHTLSTMSSKWASEGRFAEDHKWSGKQDIAVTTLDALIRQYGIPRLCKVDVEGFEMQVLKGLSSPIPLVSFEFTREFLKDALECMTQLSSLGPTQFNCSLGESMRLTYGDWTTPQDLYAKLESMDDVALWGDIYARSTARKEV